MHHRTSLPLLVAASAILSLHASGVADSGVDATSKVTSPTHRATLRAKYEFTHYGENSITGKREPWQRSFILQMSQDASYFYDPQTHYMDSLQHDPQGRIILSQAHAAALQAFAADNSQRPFETLQKQGFVHGDRYRCLKDLTAGTIRVWDTANGDSYRYSIEMADLEWTPLDSVKNILGYECQQAEADYHGRRWIAWFAPEIPVQHGPWQLQGLPGLILEAYTSDHIYSYLLTGIEQCDEEFKPTYDDQRYFDSTRKAVMRLKANATRNRSARISAMTQGNVNIASSDEEDEVMEPDYND